MRILQLIVSGTLANAGRPERVKKQNKKNDGTRDTKLLDIKQSQCRGTVVPLKKTID
jgi:hypothetical protein